MCVCVCCVCEGLWAGLSEGQRSRIVYVKLS